MIYPWATRSIRPWSLGKIIYDGSVLRFIVAAELVLGFITPFLLPTPRKIGHGFSWSDPGCCFLLLKMSIRTILERMEKIDTDWYPVACCREVHFGYNFFNIFVFLWNVCIIFIVRQIPCQANYDVGIFYNQLADILECQDALDEFFRIMVVIYSYHQLRIVSLTICSNWNSGMWDGWVERKGLFIWK